MEERKSSSPPPKDKPLVAKPKPKRRRKRKPLPLFNVVLLNDDDHSYEYVIEMLQALFGTPEPQGFQQATEVDKTGRAIVFTTHREHAELKRDQIRSFGQDPRVATSRGSMAAVIEPVEE